jgi:Tfp pilus assembly protein PilN
VPAAARLCCHHRPEDRPLSPTFHINFRREAHRREVAHARRRVVTLGVWVAYFGIVAVAMGLYGLNCMSLSRRVDVLERQTARLKATQTEREQWQVPAAEIARIEQYAGNPARWHDRLVRLAALLPDDARLLTVASNPSNQSGARAEDRLVITGHVRVGRDQDRMAGVMAFASRLREDSLFASHYSNVRVTSTRIVEGGGGTTEFVIECQ